MHTPQIVTIHNTWPCSVVKYRAQLPQKPSIPLPTFTISKVDFLIWTRVATDAADPQVLFNCGVFLIWDLSLQRQFSVHNYSFSWSFLKLILTCFNHSVLSAFNSLITFLNIHTSDLLLRLDLPYCTPHLSHLNHIITPSQPHLTSTPTLTPSQPHLTSTPTLSSTSTPP